MREHDTFRAPGAPAREEDDVCVVLVEVGTGGRGRGPPLDPLQMWDPGELGQLHREIGVRGAGQEQTWPRVLGHGPHFPDRSPCVQRRKDRAELGERGEHGHRVERGVAPPQDAVAPADAGRGQAVGEAVRLGVDLAERERVVVECRRDRVGSRARGVGEDLTDEEHGGIVAPTGLAPKAPRFQQLEGRYTQIGTAAVPTVGRMQSRARTNGAWFPFDNDC